MPQTIIQAKSTKAYCSNYILTHRMQPQVLNINRVKARGSLLGMLAGNGRRRNSASVIVGGATAIEAKLYFSLTSNVQISRQKCLVILQAVPFI